MMKSLLKFVLGIFGILAFVVMMVSAMLPSERLLDHHKTPLCEGGRSTYTLFASNGMIASRKDRFYVVECPEGKWFLSRDIDTGYEQVEEMTAKLAIIYAKRDGWTIRRIVSSDSSYQK